MSVVFCIDTLLLVGHQSSITNLYVPVADLLAPRLNAKYSLIGFGI